MSPYIPKKKKKKKRNRAKPIFVHLYYIWKHLPVKACII